MNHASQTSRCWLSFDRVRIVIGSILLITVALKTYALTTEDLVESSEFSSRLFSVLLVMSELMLAAWLFSGHRQRLAWISSMATFGVFGLTATLNALLGSRSCGCFGVIEVNPWLTGPLDAVIVMTLFIARPRLAVVHASVVQPVASNAFYGDSSSVFRERAFATVMSLCIVGLLFFVLSDFSLQQRPREPIVSDVLPAELRKGKWEVTMVRATCPACAAHLRQHHGTLKGGTSNRALLVLGRTQPWLVEFYDDFDAHFHVSRSISTGIKTPQNLVVDNGHIVEQPSVPVNER